MGLDSNAQLWEKSTGEQVKINWEAALDQSQKNMGAGVVVRDADGIVVAALAKTIPFIVDPIVVESVAAW